MSKSSFASASKSPPQLPSQSAWSKGPPQSNPSPRSQSPAPSQFSHSRRPSGLSQPASIPPKDAISLPRNAINSAKPAVSFGSIDETPPAAAPTSKQDVLPKSFTSNLPSTVTQQPQPSQQPRLPSTPSSYVNGKPPVPSSSPSPSPTAQSAMVSGRSASSTATTTASSPLPSTPKINRSDIAKLFQGVGSSSTSSSSLPSDSVSPSTRPAPLPPQQMPHQQPSQQQQQPYSPAQAVPPPSQTAPHYPTFVPTPTSLRPQQQNGPGVGPGPVPRSPVSYRPIPNGTGSRPPGGQVGSANASQMQGGLSSPRLSSHPHPGPPSGMPPPPQAMPVPNWPSYYYPPNPHEYVSYPGQWYIPPTHAVPHQPQHQPHQHHPPPPGPPGPQHAIPMSPRHPPSQLPPPGTPTQGHAVLNSAHTQHMPQTHGAGGPNSPLGVITAPPPGSQPVLGIGNGPPPQTPMGGRLNQNASTFVPSGRKVTIKSQDGTEVPIESLAQGQASSAPQQHRQSSPGLSMATGTGGGSRRPTSVRLESEQDKKLRMAIEEKERQVRVASEEKARKEKEAEAEARKKAEEEKERERIRKEEEEKRRLLKEEEERERLRKEELERQARIKKEEEEEKERLRKEELERKQREEEEKERLRKEEEERERQKREEEERHRAEQQAKAEAEAAAAAAAAAEAALKAEADANATSPIKETEDGEITEDIPGDQVKDSTQKLADNKLKDRENLRIDTSPVKLVAPPLTENPKKGRPAQLDLSSMTKNGLIPAAPHSALATARNIEDLGRVTYPEGVMSPKVELNINAKDGKFRYDREFLLQFMSICKEKPDMLPPLDAIGLEPTDQPTFSIIRGGSGRHRQPSGPNMPSSSNRPPVGLGLNTNSGFNKPNPSNLFMMGNFATHGGKLNGDERFSMSGSGRVASGPSNLPYTRPVSVMRSTSQGGSGAAPGPSMGSNRVRSKRGEKRNDSNKVPGGHSSFGPSGPGGPGANVMFEPEPLSHSGNRWVPVTLARRPMPLDPDSPEIVDRKVKGLLNKLTMEKFDSISDQIIAWANKSEKEKDGRTLIQVIRLVFEKATDEATWSEMYARLCRKMMEQISSSVQDDGIKNAEGKPITGGQLFRKYLLNRCQEDFEHGWVAKEATAAAAASKAKEDEAVKASNEKRSGEEEVALYSEEYYAAQKAKRQGLGLIKFIGELFKLQMLTERIMHECVKKLLGNVQNPEEEEIESLCKLLATVGSILDTSKARAHMDVYFSRMKELVKSPSVTARMQFMLQDVIELRERKWVSRNAVAAPTTIAQVHEAAAKEKAAQEKELYQRQMSMSRGGSRRGGDRGGDYSHVGPDGWAVAGSSGPQRPPPKAGDLSNFGKINKSTPISFGPGSVFAGKKDSKRETLSRTSSSSNIYQLLSEGNNPDVSMPSKTNHVPRKISVDLGQPPAEVMGPPQRKRLVLQPRSKPPAEEEPVPAAATALAPVSPESSSEDEAPVETMSEEDAMKKIKEDTKEFFAVRNLEEAEEYFSALPVEHRWRLVDQLVGKAIESKEADAQLVADFFVQAATKELCSAASFEDGFLPTAEILDDLAIDVPRAFPLMAMMMKGAGLDQDEERRGRITSKAMDSDKLLSLLS